MKKLFFAVAIMCAMAYTPVKAQLSVSLNLNIGSQPDWGPVGYDHVEYYYMPDIDCYYDVPNHQYIYLNGRTWTRAAVLPPRYANYDLYRGYKVVINEPRPYLHAATYRAKYAPYKGRRDQAIIRDSRDVKYRDHYNGHDNGKHKGWDKGPGHGPGHEDHGRGHH